MNQLRKKKDKKKKKELEEKLMILARQCCQRLKTKSKRVNYLQRKRKRAVHKHLKCLEVGCNKINKQKI